MTLDTCGAGPCAGSNQLWTSTPPGQNVAQNFEASKMEGGAGWCLNIPLSSGEVDHQELIMYRACGAGNSKLTLKPDGTLLANGGETNGKCLTQEPCTLHASPPCALAGGWGRTVLLLFALVSAVYVGGGTYLGVRSGRPRAAQSGVGGSPLGQHMHFELWVALYGLVCDGVAFARARHGGGAGERLLQEPREPQPDRTAKGKGKSKREGKRKSKAAGASDGHEPQPPRAASGGAPPPESAAEGAGGGTANAAGTAAGDGGRWVHVPN